jgi:hypothetical protein
MGDGTDWDVPADRVADSFANQQADKECKGIKESYERLYAIFFETMMTSEGELMDWASTQVKWEQLAQFARRVKPADAQQYDKDWPEAKKRIVVY